MREFSFVCREADRLDKLVSKADGTLSRSYARQLIEMGNVLVNQKAVTKAGAAIPTGAQIAVTVPPPQTLTAEAEEMPLDIRYEDAHLLVVNKPQGMVVHPAAGNYNGTLVNALLAHCGDQLSQINGVIRPGIVHRIDKDTSGLLLVAKDNETHLGLSRQIKEHSLNRCYMAIIHGHLREESGKIDAPIGRHPTKRKQMAVVSNGRNAVTHYQVIEPLRGYALIRCRLETGRTHQIRVHMAHCGHPVAGDPLYGVGKEPFAVSGQLLHAQELGFVHPVTGEHLTFSTEIPERFVKIINQLR